MEHLLDAFFAARSGPVQILSLGAGFDTLYFRTKPRLSAGDVVFEVDFPALVRRKVALIRATPQLAGCLEADVPAPMDTAAAEEAVKLAAKRRRKKAKKAAAAAASGDASGATSPDAPGRTPSPADVDDPTGGGMLTESYRLVGADLCHLDLASARLRAAGLRADVPTLVLSECVLTYMGPAHADPVLTWAAGFFSHALLANYEQIVPDDAFGVVMQSHFRRQSMGGRGI